jgi:hypothetical protein
LIRETLALAAELPRNDAREGEEDRERSEEDDRRGRPAAHPVLETCDERRERERQDAGDAGDDENQSMSAGTPARRGDQRDQPLRCRSWMTSSAGRGGGAGSVVMPASKAGTVPAVSSIVAIRRAATT